MTLDNNDRLQRLKNMVEAASAVFDSAVSFHEAWRPSAYDSALHQRINHSYAAYTFLTIRTALRREMLLALMRLWDMPHKKEPIRMTVICEELKDTDLLSFLISERKARWLTRYPVRPTNDLAGEETGSIAPYQTDKADLQELERHLQQKAAEVRGVILQYSQGSRSKVLDDLRALRNEHLAHHQVKPEFNPAIFNTNDTEVEDFYQDNLKLIRLLKSLVEGVAYDPEDTAKIFRRSADLFWLSVRGERNEDHPDFKMPPKMPNSL